MIVVALMIGCGKPPATQNPMLVEANQLYTSGEYAKAVETVDVLLAKDQKNFDALSLRGQIHKKWGKTDEAIEDFTKLIALDPKEPDGYAFRSQVYEDKKRLLGAKVGSGSPEWMKLHELAQADRKMHHAFDPTSVDVLKAPSSGSAKAKKLIDKPLPGFDPLEAGDSLANESAEPTGDGEVEVEIGIDGTPVPKDPFAQVSKPRNMGDENAGENGESEDDGHTEGLTSLKPTSLTSRESEEAIEERDLARDKGETEEDSPLPHGDDQESVVKIAPQIIRNNMESFLPPPTATDPLTNLYLPPEREPSTTGFNSPRENLGNRSAYNENAGQAQAPNGGNPNSGNALNPNSLNPNAPSFITPRNQTGFTSVTPFPLPGSTTQLPRNATGFNSTRTASPSNGTSPYPWIQGLNGGATRTANTGLNGPAGFLPPDAQGQFGPRIGASAGRPNPSAEGDPLQGRLPIPGSRLTSPPLTMALPGTAQTPNRPTSTTGVTTGIPITTGAPISTVNPFDRSLAPNLPPTVIQAPSLPVQ